MSRRRLFVALLLLFGLLGQARADAGTAEPDATAAIVGGQPVTSGWESTVAVYSTSAGGTTACTGTVVSPTWVLTAAHCLTGSDGQHSSWQVEVIVGTTDVLAGGRRIAASRTVVHPEWNSATKVADLALVELVSAAGVTPMPLMAPGSEPLDPGGASFLASAAGFGASEVGGGAIPQLRAVDIPVFGTDRCQAQAAANFYAFQSVCGGTAAANVCSGDSGGPLVATSRTDRRGLLGIIARGNCQGPSVFVRVAWFRDWIRSTAGSDVEILTSAPGLLLLRRDGKVDGHGAGAASGTVSCGPSGCGDVAAHPSGAGGWVANRRCQLTRFGSATVFSASGLNEPCRIVPTPTGLGLWAMGASGKVSAVGDAVSYGHFTKPANGAWLEIERTPSGKGYWLVGNDGGIFTYGDAAFLGSTGAMRLNAPIVSMASTPSGRGYWLVAADGGVFSYGDAAFFGSTASVKPRPPVHTILPSPTGRGYWLVASDSRVFAFGDATRFSVPSLPAGSIVSAGTF